ncbi:hypothetical protein BGX27_001376, partial [Mortierella sp. AM989]
TSVPLTEYESGEDTSQLSSTIAPDQQSLGSVSTLDLPSPALSSKDKKSDKSSWVWRWAEKKTDETGKLRVYCTVSGCQQQKGWSFIRGSTSNIRNHLIVDHHLNANSEKNSFYTGQSASIAAQGKRSAAHFSTDLFEHQSPDLKVLLELAHAAPSVTDLSLPSNDTITRRVSKSHMEYEELIRQELTAVPMVAFTLDGWTSPFKSSFLVITGHWVDDNWALQDVTLALKT